MSIQVKIQVPIDRDVRNKLEARATKLGFDSVQAFIRFWAKAEVEGRKVSFDEDDWGQPSSKAAVRLNGLALQAERDSKAGRLKSYTNVDDFMKDLVNDEADPTQ